jgi:hypothetical protein
MRSSSYMRMAHCWRRVNCQKMRSVNASLTYRSVGSRGMPYPEWVRGTSTSRPRRCAAEQPPSRLSERCEQQLRVGRLATWSLTPSCFARCVSWEQTSLTLGGHPKPASEGHLKTGQS